MAAKKRRGGWLALAVAIALAFFSHPPNEWVIALCAVLSLLLICALNDYPPRGADGFQRMVRWVFLVVGWALASSVWGAFWWQRITVSPNQVSFRGYPNETFNFSVRNERDDDVYDVQIPFLIGYGVHLDNEFSAKVMPNGDPPQRIYDDYNYCFGEKGDGNIHHVQKNEREVLIVKISHLPPFGYRSFSVTYTGGPEVQTGPGRPNFILEPYSYSSMQSTIGVRGDYRICKFSIATNGWVGAGGPP